jgi:hypothetical protein
MNTTTPEAQAADAAADALFEAVVTYSTAWAAHVENPQGLESAEAALKAALSKSREMCGALEAACDAEDIEVLEGMLDEVQQSTARARAAVDKALTLVGESNKRMANCNWHARA